MEPIEESQVREPAQLLRVFETMCRISATDRLLRRESRHGRLKGTIYPVHGLEAVCASMGELLEVDDYLVSTYRNLGDIIAKGVPVVDVLAEDLGMTSGTSAGRGGPMHQTAPGRGLMVTSGIVGGGIPIAVGLALAAQLAGKRQLAVTTFGDGATSIGAFHEALGFAALWKLPIVFVCQNNQWGEHTALKDYAPNPRMSEKATSYAMPGTTVDGFDPVALLDVLGHAFERARSGQGPTLVECNTYRLSGHASNSDFSYVPADELEQAMRKDPTPTMHRYLVEEAGLGETEVQSVEDRVAIEVEAAFEVASAGTSAAGVDVHQNVFASTARER